MMFGWKITLIEAKKIIDLCIKNKIKFFDTSPSYGNGLSEIICGEILKSFKRKQFELSTKFSLKNKKIKVAESIKSSINKSLERLQTHYLDYFVLHHSVSLKKLRKVVKTIKELKRKKKIKSFILSNPSNALLKQIPKDLPILKQIDGFQFKHNILFKNDNIFKILKFKKFKLISYSPLAEGLLTGKYLKKTKFGRIVEATKKKNYYKSLLSKKNKIIITKLYNACNKNFYDLTRKSYSFLLKDYRISNILIGVSSFEQLSKNISIINKIN